MANVIRIGGGGGSQNLTLPPMVSNLAASTGDQSITLTWDNPDSDALAGILIVYNDEHVPTKISDGTKVDAGLVESHMLTGLTNETLYYIRVFPYNEKKQYQTMLEGATVTATPDDFPAEPTEYSEIEKIYSTEEWVAPETGHFKIVALAKSGDGGTPAVVSHSGSRLRYTAGGGGSGAIVVSIFKMSKGEKVLLTINSDVSVNFNDETALATSGKDGTGARDIVGGYGYGGAGGEATGGNAENINGTTGGGGEGGYYEGRFPGGTGATNSYDGYSTTGGTGEGLSQNTGTDKTPRTYGTAAYVVILRGNTNIPSPSAASTLSLTPRNASIEASWTNSEDPESVGTLLVSNPTHEPQDITDGTAIDVAEATSYTLTDLPNDKPTYISLFSYNADKSKYSAAKSNVEIPREVTWADTQDALEQDVEEKTEQLTTVIQEYEVEVKTMASAGISQVKAYCEATSNPPMTDVGVFASGVDEWKAGVEYKLNDLFTYQGNMGYVKQPTLTSLDVYPPFSVGTEALYGARPKPDADGIYPYVYNMGIYKGMLVRDDDGVLYRSITGTQERPTELLYHPKYVPTLLEKVEEGGEEAPSEEYPEWVRPTGAHDAYAQGAKVSHNGKKWTSDVGGNVWEPGVYGWTEVI